MSEGAASTGTVSSAAARPADAPGEAVLCVPRATIFPDGAWHGLVTTGLERILRTIRAASHYRPRTLVEDDPEEQQIIPYCVVRDARNSTYLVTRRLRAGTEVRLHDRFSLGVGGHVNPTDGRGGDPVLGGLQREWAEEIVCPTTATARLVAVLNDDTTPVSRVHLGLVFIVEPEEGRASVREIAKLAGEWMSLDALAVRYQEMESWSQLVYDGLRAGLVDRAASSPLVQVLDTCGDGARAEVG